MFCRGFRIRASPYFRGLLTSYVLLKNVCIYVVLIKPANTYLFHFSDGTIQCLSREPGAIIAIVAKIVVRLGCGIVHWMCVKLFQPGRICNRNVYIEGSVYGGEREREREGERGEEVGWVRERGGEGGRDGERERERERERELNNSHITISITVSRCIEINMLIKQIHV